LLGLFYAVVNDVKPEVKKWNINLRTYLKKIME
jgi:hypothetical protein